MRYNKPGLGTGERVFYFGGDKGTTVIVEMNLLFSEAREICSLAFFLLHPFSLLVLIRVVGASAFGGSALKATSILPWRA